MLRDDADAGIQFVIDDTVRGIPGAGGIKSADDRACISFQAEWNRILSFEAMHHLLMLSA